MYLNVSTILFQKEAHFGILGYMKNEYRISFNLKNGHEIGYFNSSKYDTPSKLVLAPGAIFRGNTVVPYHTVSDSRTHIIYCAQFSEAHPYTWKLIILTLERQCIGNKFQHFQLG